MGTWAVLLGCRAPADLRDLWPEAEPAWGPLVPGWALGLSSDFEGRANLPETLARAPGHALAGPGAAAGRRAAQGAGDAVRLRRRRLARTAPRARHPAARFPIAGRRGR